MDKLFRLLALMLCVLPGVFAHASEIRVDSAWARATVPGQDSAMVSLTLTSKRPTTLMKISSAVCRSVEMHHMTHDDGMMEMREVKSIKLPAGKRVDFEEEGYHLMLVGLKSALKEGDRVPLTLSLKRGDSRVIKVEVQAIVKSLSAARTAD
jgi:copper(I)-binding protein